MRILSSSSLVPRFLRSALISEAAFAAAYDAVTAKERAWLKTTIALAHLNAGSHGGRAVTIADCRHGFDLTRKFAPYDWGILTTGAHQSPSRLLAALAPMILGHISEIAVVITDDASPCPLLLTALELAGQENVLRLDAVGFDRLLEHNLRSGCGLWVDLSEASSCYVKKSKGSLRIWRPIVNGRLGVWSAQTDWDAEAIAMAAGRTSVEVWGRVGPSFSSISGLVRRKGSFETFLRQSYDAVYVPVEMSAAALENFALVFNPGAEGCWIWTDLEQGVFSRTSVMLAC